MEATPRFELGVELLQSSALPLGYVAVWITGEMCIRDRNKVYANYTVEQIELAKSLRDVFSVLMIALPICFVVLLIWAVVARKSGKFTRLSSVLAGVMLALAVCAVVIREMCIRDRR